MKKRIVLMALGFVVGAFLALALVQVIGWVSLLRGWGAVGLLITVVIAWGMHGEAETGPTAKTGPTAFDAPRTTKQLPRCQCAHLCKRPIGIGEDVCVWHPIHGISNQSAGSDQTVRDYWYEQAKKNQEAALPLSSDPAQGMRDEINRIVALGADANFTNQHKRKDRQ